MEGSSEIAANVRHNSVKTPNYGMDNAATVLDGTAELSISKSARSTKTPNFGVDKAGDAVTGMAENPVAKVSASHRKTPYGPTDTMAGMLCGTDTGHAPSPRPKQYVAKDGMSASLNQTPLETPTATKTTHHHTPYGADDNAGSSIQGNPVAADKSINHKHATRYGKAGSVFAMLHGEEPVENLKNTPTEVDATLKEHKVVANNIFSHHHHTPFGATDSAKKAVEGKPKDTMTEVIGHHHHTPYGPTDHVKKAVEGKPKNTVGEVISHHHLTPQGNQASGGGIDHAKKAVEGKPKDTVGEVISHHRLTPQGNQASGGGIDHVSAGVFHPSPVNNPGYMGSTSASKAGSQAGSRASSPPTSARGKSKELQNAVWHQPNSPAAGGPPKSGDGGVYTKPAKRGARPPDQGIF